MSIQYEALEDTDLEQHRLMVQAMLNDGWMRVGGHVTVVGDGELSVRVYTTFMTRSPVNERLDAASLVEVVRESARLLQTLMHRIAVTEDRLDEDKTK